MAPRTRSRAATPPRTPPRIAGSDLGVPEERSMGTREGGGWETVEDSEVVREPCASVVVTVTTIVVGGGVDSVESSSTGGGAEVVVVVVVEEGGLTGGSTGGLGG